MGYFVSDGFHDLFVCSHTDEILRDADSFVSAMAGSESTLSSTELESPALIEQVMLL
jgi:hypothetical protein